MAGGLSLYALNSLEAHLFRQASFTMPAAGYLSIFITNPGPGDAAGAITGTEATYTGYARVAVTFAAPSGGVIANSNTVTFGTSSSAGGTGNYCGFHDASSAGHLLAIFPIGAISLASGSIPIAAIGALTMTGT